MGDKECGGILFAPRYINPIGDKECRGTLFCPCVTQATLSEGYTLFSIGLCSLLKNNNLKNIQELQVYKFKLIKVLLEMFIVDCGSHIQVLLLSCEYVGRDEIQMR